MTKQRGSTGGSTVNNNVSIAYNPIEKEEEESAVIDNLPFKFSTATSSITSTTVATRVTGEKTDAVDKTAARCHAKGCSKPWKKICSKCRVAKYCSRECQIRDWKTRHKEFCGREEEKLGKIQKQEIRDAADTQCYTKSPAAKSIELMFTFCKTVNGHMKFLNHAKACVLCDRYNQLRSKSKIDFPTALEHLSNMETYIHANGYEYNLPFWLDLGDTGKPQVTNTSRRYNSLAESLRHDFVNEDRFSLTPDSETGNDYIISYSLYVDDIQQFPEYWLGLKMNIDAVRQWFAGWTIHLFVEKTMARGSLLEKMGAYAKKAGVNLEIIECLEGSHPMLERYRPLMDHDYGVCIVRDVDSILSLTDAKIIDCWLQDPDQDVLSYLEHRMTGHVSCGGGVALKLDKKKPRVDRIESVFGKTRGRNFDEDELTTWLQKATDPQRRTTVQVRMAKRGTYCLDYYWGEPKILWACSFRSLKDRGSISTLKECEDACEKLIDTAQSETHVHSHTKKNRDKLLGKRVMWAR